MIKAVLILFFSLFITSFAEESFSWEVKKLTYNAQLGDKGTPFVFKFKNISDKEVEIEKIKSSCSCMSIKSTFPKKVKAGESGLVEAYYDFTGKVGFNRGNIEVIVDGKRISLNVEVDIPVPVTINPRFIIWKKGEREPKEIAVTLHPDWKGKMLSVKTTEKEIKTEMKKTEKGYKVSVTPPSADVLKKKRTWVLLNGEDEQGQHLEYRIYLILN